MLAEDDRAFLYQIKVNGIEAEYLSGLGPPTPFPDLEAFAKRPIPHAFLQAVQNAIWTIRRIGKATNAFNSRAQSYARGEANRKETFSSRPSSESSRPSSEHLFLDLTAIHRGRLEGGIRRVCLKFAEFGAGLRYSTPFALVDGVPRRVDGEFALHEPISFMAGDTYLVLDSFWDFVEERRAALSNARDLGALTILYVHDLIQLAYPGLLRNSYVEACEKSLPTLLANVDAVATSCRSTASDIRRQMQRRGFPRRPIIWSHFGADSIARRSTVHGDRKSLISIGTLEPKKGYPIVLDAFEQVWAEGIDADYTIVGKRGWLCEALARRILEHREYGKRLFWLSEASDSMVQELASRSCGLIQASVAEGFGLPLIEAAHLGLPVIASDLSAFREIAGESMLSFPPLNSPVLAGRIKELIAGGRSQITLNTLTWSQAVLGLVAAIDLIRVQRGYRRMTQTDELASDDHFGQLCR